MDYIKHVTLNQDLIITRTWKGDDPDYKNYYFDLNIFHFAIH